MRDFEPLHSLFRKGQRTPLGSIIHDLIGDNPGPRPLVVLDLSASSGAAWLDDDGVRARIMSEVLRHVRIAADTSWQDAGKPVNCSIVFDEAHRFAASKNEDPNIDALMQRIVRDVRETRKVGIGWTLASDIGARDSSASRAMR